MTEKQIAQYLERIGYTGSREPSLETLAGLQLAHLLTVPYENLDILTGADMPLDEAGLFDKIVTRHRGGYCFELNGLFGKLLRALGYSVTDCFARFLKNEKEIPKRRHRVLIVRVPGGGRYVADVGVGLEIPRQPVSLDGTATGIYRVVTEPFFGHVLYEGNQRLYAFTEEPQLDRDFDAIHFYCRFMPDSFFRQGAMVAIRTPNGRLTLDGDVFRTFSSEGVREERFEDPADFAREMKKRFGLESTGWR